MAGAAGTRVAFVLTALLLMVWSVLHVNAVIYDADNRPVLRIAEGGSEREASLREALRANPAEVTALLELAADRRRGGDAATARRAYMAALEIAPIDPATLRASADFELSQGRSADALVRLDRIAELYPDDRAWIFPAFERMLGAGVELDAFEALASRATGWMGAFLEHACGKDVDPGILATLLIKRAAGGRARNVEVGCTTERLRRTGSWDLAYQVWLNTLPRQRLGDIGFIFNGSFEQAATGVGFDWIADERSPSQTVEYPLADSGAAGRRALRVTYTGKRTNAAAIRQNLVVPPGRYELRGMVRLQGLQSVRGIQWIVRCDVLQGRGETVGASERFIGSSEWQPFAFEVNVPRSCPGQVLALEPAGLHESTTYVAGKAWFDDLRLTRLR